MRRNPFLHWLLTLVTFGQYGIVWTFLMARDVNRANSAMRLHLRTHVGVFSLAYAIYISGFLYLGPWSMRTTEGFQRLETVSGWMLPLAVGLTVYWGWLLVFIARALRSLNSSNKPATGTVVLLSFLWATSLPFLQKCLNEVIQSQSGNPR